MQNLSSNRGGSWYRLAEGGRHLVGERSGDDHAVGLAGGWAEDDAEAVEVVTSRAGVHHLDSAAGEPESHRPDRPPARPVHEIVYLGDHEFRRLRPRRRWRHAPVRRGWSRRGACGRRSGVGPRRGEEGQARRAREQRHGRGAGR